MDKATPVEMRKALKIVSEFKKQMIPFIPMPFLDKEDFEKTFKEMQSKLQKIIEITDK